MKVYLILSGIVALIALLAGLMGGSNIGGIFWGVVIYLAVFNPVYWAIAGLCWIIKAGWASEERDREIQKGILDELKKKNLNEESA